MRTGSFSEYAAHRGVAPAYVTKLKKQGRLVLVQVDGKEKVNFDRSDLLIANTTDLGRSRNGDNAKPAEQRQAQPSPATLEEEAPAPSAASLPGGGGGPAAGPVGVDVVFRRAQAQERVFSAKTAELQYRKAAGELIERALVERTVFDAFRALRDQAFLAPQRAAARAINQADPAAIEKVMLEELRRGFDSWEARFADRLPKKGAAA